MISTLTTYWAPRVLSLLRIAAALIFIAHGTQKLFGFPVPPQSGLPAAFTLYWIGGVLEAFGGFLLLIGLFTRPVAFLLSGQMAVAYWMFHAPRNVYPLLNGGDASILYCFVFLYIAFGRRRVEPRQSVGTPDAGARLGALSGRAAC